MRVLRPETPLLGVPERLAAPGRCLVMGILNVTPDSFSDGGRWFGVDAAVERAMAMVDQGADLIDVGGESTRPGALRVDPAQELDRVLPVISTLAQEGVIVSVDTVRASTAEIAIEAGARLINDVSGGRVDPDMAAVVADAQIPYVLMHWRGPSEVMDSLATYHDVLLQVAQELCDQVEVMMARGVRQEAIILDPGFGFAKNAEHNWRLLAGLDQFVALGRPLLVGTARKRFLSEAVARAGVQPPTAGERDAATAATTTLAAAAGAWGVRVHEVAASADAVRVVELTRRAARDGASMSAQIGTVSR